MYTMKPRTLVKLSPLLLVPLISARWSLRPFTNEQQRIAGDLVPTSSMPLPNIQLPNPLQGGGRGSDGDGDQVNGDLIISDVIGRERCINMFAGFTRDIDQASSRLEDAQKNSTILAPLNSQIQNLPRKPWEDPQDYQAMGEQAYAGSSGDGRAHRNLRKFVEAHIVPKSPWKEGTRVKTMAGNEVWWESKDGKHYVRTWTTAVNALYMLTTDQIQPDNIEITSIASRASNGEVWIMAGVLNYTQ